MAEPAWKSAPVEGANEAWRTAPVEGEEQAAPQAPQSLLQQNVQTVKNIPASAAKNAGMIFEAITHPVETTKAIGGALQGAAVKVGRKYEEAITGEDIAPDPREAPADAIGKYIKDRYGSLDAFKSTVQEDPVGVLIDFAGGAQLAPGKLGAIGRAVEPIGAAGRAVVKMIPENAAANLYQRAAKFSTTQFGKTAKGLEDRRAATQTALDEGLMPTHSGVRKMGNAIDFLDASLDELIDAATVAGESIPVEAVLTHVTPLMKEKGGFRLGAAEDVAKIQKIVGDFHRGLKGREKISPRELQDFKRDLYRQNNYDRGKTTANLTVEDTRKAMARASKEELDALIPTSSELNQSLGELLELQPHLVRAANRIANRDMVSLTTGLATGAGAGLGGFDLGVGVGLLTAVLTNPRLKARTAIALNRLKKGDIGWINKNINLPEVRVALNLAGRANEIVGSSNQQETPANDLPVIPLSPQPQ